MYVDYACTCHDVHVDVSATLWNWFSPSTLCGLGIEIRSASMTKRMFTCVSSHKPRSPYFEEGYSLKSLDFFSGQFMVRKKIYNLIDQNLLSA